MGRPRSSARLAPLPADASARLHRTVGARLSAALSDPELVELARALCVPWLLADRGRLRLDRARRLRLAPEPSRMIKRLARSLVLMTESGQAFGQQAAKVASKTLRALRNRRIDMDGFLDLEAGYRTLRRDYRRRHGSPAVHAPEETILLDDGGMVATRVVSERLLTRLGRQAGNCLADPPYRKGYAARMKRGRTAFWRIDPADQPDVPVWVIGTSVRTGVLQELEFVAKSLIMPRDRDALLGFLTARAKVGRVWREALSRFAISPGLVAASQAGAVRSIEASFAGSLWRFEVGTPGVLAAQPADGPFSLCGSFVISWMLHGAQTSATETLAVQHTRDGEDCDDSLSGLPDDVVDDDDDGESWPETPAGPQTMMELELRFALRGACRASPALRRACREAFAAESPLFIEDWFGIVHPG